MDYDTSQLTPIVCYWFAQSIKGASNVMKKIEKF